MLVCTHKNITNILHTTHTHTLTNIHTLTHIHTHIHSCTYTHTHTHIHTIWTHTHADYINTHTNTHMLPPTSYTPSTSQAYTHTHMHSMIHSSAHAHIQTLTDGDNVARNQSVRHDLDPFPIAVHLHNKERGWKKKV